MTRRSLCAVYKVVHVVCDAVTVEPSTLPSLQYIHLFGQPRSRPPHPNKSHQRFTKHVVLRQFVLSRFVSQRQHSPRRLHITLQGNLFA